MTMKNIKATKNTNGTKTEKTAVNGTKLSDMKPVTLTREEFDSKSPAEIVDLMTKPESRISPERAKADLVKRVAEGRVNSLSAAIMMAYTYNSLRVEGVKPIVTGGYKEENAKVRMTQEDFDKLSSAEKADLIKNYSHKNRVASDILPALIVKGMPLSPEDAVYLTHGRVMIEGVTVVNTSTRQPVPTDGVTFA